MDKLRALLAVLFPYRAHLEAEITYLREQVAQKQRRIDELQESVIQNQTFILERARAKAQAKPETGKPIPMQPRGWDEVRAHRRANPQPEETPDAVQSQ